MDPNLPKYGGGVSATVLHPLVLVAMLLAMMLLLVLPRRYVVLPVLVTTFLIPLGQQFYLAGIHLFVIRLIILTAYLRAMVSEVPNEKSRYAGGWNSIDTAFTCYVVISAIATMVQYPELGALLNQIGFLWDYLLAYLLMRSLIRDERDTLLVIKCLAILMGLLGTAMVFEQIKMVNVFGFLGGVNAVPEVRGGKIRAQAAFQHALTAGSFAAMAIPLFFLLWKDGKSKLLSVIGLVAATVMTMATQSSTCLLTYATGVVALSIWPLRKKMKMVCGSLVALLVGLDLVMKAPVWFVIARIDLTGSSSSYQRAELIDQFVNHFSSWWIVGTKYATTWGWGMWDAQDMYVSVGEGGGLAALVFFILVISRSFVSLGEARTRTKSVRNEWLFWSLGAALSSNVVAFLGVNYFDQSKMAWFVLVSMICACTARRIRLEPESTLQKNTVNYEWADAYDVGDEIPNRRVGAYEASSRHPLD